MGLSEIEIEIITKIADSVAKDWGFRFRYDKQCKNIKFFGPKDCLIHIIEEVNKTLNTAKIKLNPEHIEVCRPGYIKRFLNDSNK